jgi:hypothetical protein
MLDKILWERVVPHLRLHGRSATPRWSLWDFEAVSYSIDFLEAILQLATQQLAGISSSRITHNKLTVLKINANQ